MIQFQTPERRAAEIELEQQMKQRLDQIVEKMEQTGYSNPEKEQLIETKEYSDPVEEQIIFQKDYSQLPAFLEALGMEVHVDEGLQQYLGTPQGKKLEFIEEEEQNQLTCIIF